MKFIGHLWGSGEVDEDLVGGDEDFHVVHVSLWSVFDQIKTVSVPQSDIQGAISTLKTGIVENLVSLRI